MEKYLTIIDIINDVKASLKNENYIAALATALTIPDKCGKIAYENSKDSKERYVRWYNEWCWIGDSAINGVELPDADGEFIYQLRCAILHEHSTELKYEKLENKNKLDKFELEISDFNGVFSVFASSIFNDGEEKSMRIRLVDLCEFICYCAEQYYKQNKHKFQNTNKIKIVDYRDVHKSMFQK